MKVSAVDTGTLRTMRPRNTGTAPQSQRGKQKAANKAVRIPVKWLRQSSFSIHLAGTKSCNAEERRTPAVKKGKACNKVAVQKVSTLRAEL